MFMDVVYLILGFIVGFLLAIILGAGGRSELEEQIVRLEHRNRDLEERQRSAATPEAAYEQEKERD